MNNISGSLLGLPLPIAKEKLAYLGVNSFTIKDTKAPKLQAIEGNPWVIKVTWQDDVLEMVVAHIKVPDEVKDIL